MSPQQDSFLSWVILIGFSILFWALVIWVVKGLFT